MKKVRKWVERGEMEKSIFSSSNLIGGPGTSIYRCNPKPYRDQNETMIKKTLCKCEHLNDILSVPKFAAIMYCIYLSVP